LYLTIFILLYIITHIHWLITEYRRYKTVTQAQQCIVKQLLTTPEVKGDRYVNFSHRHLHFGVSPKIKACDLSPKNTIYSHILSSFHMPYFLICCSYVQTVGRAAQTLDQPKRMAVNAPNNGGSGNSTKA